MWSTLSASYSKLIASAAVLSIPSPSPQNLETQENSGPCQRTTGLNWPCPAFIHLARRPSPNLIPVHHHVFFFFGALHSSMRHTPSSGLRGGQDGDRCPIEGGDGWAAGWLPMRLVWWSVLHDSIAGWPVVFSSQFSMPIPQRCGDTDMVAIFRHMGRISPFNLNCRRPLFTPCGLLLQSLQNKDFLGRLPAVRSVGSHAGTALLLPLQGLLPLSISAPFIISGGVGQRRQESSFTQRPFNTTTASPREDKFSRPREIDIITPSKSLPLRIRGTWFVTVLTVTVLGSTTMFPGR